MSRARKLSEIAKANQTVFSSTNGTQWWLADPSAKNDPEPAPPSEHPEPQPAVARQAIVAVQEPEAESPIVQSSAPVPVLSQVPEVETPTDFFAPPETEAPSDYFAPPELQEPSNGASPAESEPVARDFASRLSSLKDRFLWLGRKNRTAEME